MSSSTSWQSTLLVGRARADWPWLLVEGILGVIAGVAALIWPDITVLVLAVFLGIALLMQGTMEIVMGTRAVPGTPGRAWIIVFGILAVFAGVICLVHPGAGVFAIILGVAVWFLIAGVNDLARAGRSSSRGLSILLGILSILAAIVVIVRPDVAITTVAIIAGIGFLIRGILDISLALAIRRALR
jgi:uncharacterized membrane protein HdeD (DUF308 family)